MSLRLAFGPGTTQRYVNGFQIAGSDLKIWKEEIK